MKRLFRLFLLLLALLLPATANAHNFEVDGIYYNKNGTEATVTYKGTSYDDYSNEYTGLVTIPSTVSYNGRTYSVTAIDHEAFYDCSGLTSVTIPNSVTSIGFDAFRGCSGLTSVTIPNSVTRISSYAFQGCTALDTLNYNAVSCEDFSSSYRPFYNLNISVINIGNSVERVPANFAWGLSKLTNVTIGNSVTTIGKNAFQGCTALDTLNFNAVSCADFSSSSRPFEYLNISVINIGNSVERIPANFAYGLSKLTSVTIPNSVTSIGNEAFRACSGMTSVVIPNSVTTIGDYAFDYCSGLSSVTIPNSVTTINKNAFSCSGLTSVTIPNSVTTIGYSAFSGCSGLTSVTIPNSVTRISSYAFQGCTALDTLNYNAVSCEDFSSYSYYCPFYNLNISVINIGNSVERIPAYFAYDLSKLTSVTIPNSVTSIGSSAFSGCSGLTSVTIPNSVTTIGDYAFHNCSGLTSVTIPNSVTSIDRETFQGCSGLTSVTIPNSVTTIGLYAFEGCRGLTNITIPNSVTTIDEWAFYNCNNLKSITSLKPEAVYLPSTTFSTFSSATLTVPVGSYYSYKQTDCWSYFYRIIESTPVDSVVLNYNELYLHIGDVVRLSATILPADASQQVTWSTSNSAVVSVESDGTVTGLDVGSATITATSRDGSGRYASCLVTVLADNLVYLDTLTHIRGEAAELVEIPISFSNRNAISAIQFDVSLPSSCASFGYPVMRVNESRVTSSHTFSYNKLSNNSYRVLIASPTSQVLNGDDGPLVYLNVLLNKSVSTAGDYYINISNAIAAEPDETRHVLENAYGVIRYYYIVGDADGDLSVDIADYNATASKILGRSPSPFFSDAADVDQNSSINVTDLVGITNISLGIKPITVRYAPRQGSDLNRLTCEPLVIAAGEEGEISLEMDCSFDFAAFQMDVALPQGLTLTGATLGSDASKLQLATATLPDGSIRLLASSFSDAEVRGDCPKLLTLNVKAANDFNVTDEGIAFTHITFAERNLTSHELDDLEVDLYCPSRISEHDDDTHIYVEEGKIIIESPVDGLVMVSDISGHARDYPVGIGRNEITPWCTGILIIKMNSQVFKINMK